jgi:hypothetical protein
MTGTSTGSLMASMLAFGYTPEEVATVYEKFVPKVMTYCMFDCWWYVGNVFRSKYRNDNLAAAAAALFAGHKYEVLSLPGHLAMASEIAFVSTIRKGWKGTVVQS